jgi:hypothetical protein
MAVIACRHCHKLLQYEKIADLPFFPFCCERCKLLDLGDWLDEKHRISGEGSESEESPPENGGP